MGLTREQFKREFGFQKHFLDYTHCVIRKVDLVKTYHPGWLCDDVDWIKNREFSISEYKARQTSLRLPEQAGGYYKFKVTLKISFNYSYGGNRLAIQTALRKIVLLEHFVPYFSLPFCDDKRMHLHGGLYNCYFPYPFTMSHDPNDSRLLSQGTITFTNIGYGVLERPSDSEVVATTPNDQPDQ